MTVKIEMTEDEALSLRNLLDVAVKAAGLRAAEFALVIDKKILDAAKAQAASTVAAGELGEPK